MSHYVTALIAICHREALRFFGQRARMIAALVRPLMWLFVFAAGFRAALGLSITPPYETYISYETYIVPGLCAMILLFNGMQSSLSLVMDREMGTMRLLLTAPLPRWWLLSCKLVAGAVISVLQAVVFLAICAVYGIRFSPMGYVAALPAMFLCALMVGALGIALSSTIRSLENFAGVMNFVIFPMFFLSTALYPLWKMAEASELLWWICAINPFSHGVETIRFALYLKADPVDWAITVAGVAVFMALALWGYDPGKRTMGRKG